MVGLAANQRQVLSLCFKKYQKIGKYLPKHFLMCQKTSREAV
jgi:hypothetical protein